MKNSNLFILYTYYFASMDVSPYKKIGKRYGFICCDLKRIYKMHHSVKRDALFYEVIFYISPLIGHFSSIQRKRVI